MNPEIISQHVRDISKRENYIPESQRRIYRSVRHVRVSHQLRIHRYNNICSAYFVFDIQKTVHRDIFS